MTIGKRVAALRKSRGITRKELAATLEIPETTLRNYELDINEPGHTFLIKVAAVFKVSTDYLLGLDNREKPTPPQSMYNSSERALIKKYRTLDEYGQRVVDSVVDIEYERCTAFDPLSDYAAAHEQGGQSIDDINDAGRY